MKTLQKIRENPIWAIALMIIIYLVGMVGLSLEVSRAIFQQLTPMNLIISLFVMFVYHKNRQTVTLLVLLFALLLGFLIEMLGVNTGIVFGSYTYGPTLGIAVAGTPLMIGVNWLMLTYAVWAWTSNLNLQIGLKVILSAVLMVVYDFVLEPVAIELNMWWWEHAEIPIQNYVAWFAISVVIFTTFAIFRQKWRNKVAIAIFVIQFMFFVILNFTI